MTLSAPQQQGDMLSQADCLGHTMIVAPTEFIDHIQTVNTKPGEKSPAIRVNVADFADPDSPVIYRGVLWFGVISGSLRRSIGEFLAARMSQGTASPGRNAPWFLQDVTTEADWMAHLGNWLDNTPVGVAFQAEAIEEVNRVAQAAAQSPAAPPAAVAAPAPAPVAAAPAPRPAVAAPAAAPTPSPASSPGLARPAAPAPAAAAPVVTVDPNVMAQLGGLPPGELEKALAIIAQQNQAAH